LVVQVQKSWLVDITIIAKSIFFISSHLKLRSSELFSSDLTYSKSSVLSMDEEIYDEFGNLIGGENDSLASSSESEIENISGEKSEEESDVASHNENESPQQNNQQLVPTFEKVYGNEVEVLIEQEDAQDINVPLVQPEIVKSVKIEETDLPSTTYSKDYLAQLSQIPERVINLAFVGNLHSGKTSCIDMFVEDTHDYVNQEAHSSKNYKPQRYTDTYKLEIERQTSIKSTPITILGTNLAGQSSVLNIIDTPGHIDFLDELAVSLRAVDNAVIVLDCLEGLTIGTELVIENCLKTGTNMILMVNKFDRLILELKLPIQDAYFKLRHVIEQVNLFIKESPYLTKNYKSKRLSPELGNVCFSSTTFNTCFTLYSFAELYVQTRQLTVHPAELSKRLWGDVFYDPETRKFSKKGKDRSFIKFILEPIYKLVSITITKTPEDLSLSLAKLNITDISKKSLQLDSQILLKIIFKRFFGKPLQAFTSLLNKSAVSPVESTETKFSSIYHGPHISCDSARPLVAVITKLLDASQGTSFLGLCRVVSGTLERGSQITVIGEGFSESYDEDSVTVPVSALFIPGGRYQIPVSKVSAGNICLLSSNENFDNFISRQVVIYDSSNPEKFNVEPIDYILTPVLKVALQPMNLSETPKFLTGLRKIKKSFPGSQIKVEESGEHVVIGSGEFYMDCLLHDLRYLYTDIEIKVSDPVTKFMESCIESSKVRIPVESSNGKNSISIIAEPLEPEIAKDMESGRIDVQYRQSNLKYERFISRWFKEYGWDSLAANSIWSLGPESHDTNILIDDTLPDEVDKKALKGLQDSVVQGFKWAAREGPLCDEPISNTKFKIIEASLASSPLDANGGQIIPMVRKACYLALMIATPKLMEPVYQIDILCRSDVVGKLEKLLDKRRGTILHDTPIGGTPLYRVVGMVPVIDSFGLETDIRVMTQGLATCLLHFARWDAVPGDPLDEHAFIPQLKPAPFNSLARDFVTKTRKRKGIGQDPSLTKYLDESVVMELKESGVI